MHKYTVPKISNIYLQMNILLFFFSVHTDIVFLGARENENGLLVWLDGEAVRDQ